VSEPVNLRILDREYLVACPAEERDSLLSAAQLVDSRLRDVRNAHRSATLDRWAVLVALNLANELGQLRNQLRQRDHELERALHGLTQRLDGLLAQAPARSQSTLPLREG
jgi:cell division protein ZapA